MADEITKLYTNSDVITENTTTITAVFQFANVEHIQRRFSAILVKKSIEKLNSIPLLWKDINLPLIKSSQGLTNH